VAVDNTQPAVDLGEEDDAFARRRAAGERRLISVSSCVVRSVHEELLEAYEDRAASGTDDPALDALLESIDGEIRGAEERR
jgi:hypothetical protein